MATGLQAVTAAEGIRLLRETHVKSGKTFELNPRKLGAYAEVYVTPQSAVMVLWW